MTELSTGITPEITEIMFSYHQDVEFQCVVAGCHPSDVEVSKFKWFIDDIEITDKRQTYNESITITLDTQSEPNGGGKAIGRLKVS